MLLSRYWPVDAASADYPKGITGYMALCQKVSLDLGITYSIKGESALKNKFDCIEDIVNPSGANVIWEGLYIPGRQVNWVFP